MVSPISFCFAHNRCFVLLVLLLLLVLLVSFWSFHFAVSGFSTCQS